MPENKDWKRRVRARMQKTGESYTAARAALLQKSPPRRRAKTATTAKTASDGAPPARPPRTKPIARRAQPATDHAALAGVADAAVVKATGCSWDEWVKSLDHRRAHEWTHTEIARCVRETWQVSGWWSQTVAIGYERIKGMRAIGQRSSGAFGADKSRTFAVPVARVFAAWRDEDRRRTWLDAEPTARGSRQDHSIRFDWPDGTSVNVMFVKKGEAKTQVAIGHEKLPDRDASLRAKVFWTAALDRVAGALS